MKNKIVYKNNNKCQKECTRDIIVIIRAHELIYIKQIIMSTNVHNIRR